jgi:hypothetical protein
MTRLSVCRTLCIALCITLGACGVVDPGTTDTAGAEATGTVEQAGIEMQGIEMQGIEMQGIEMQGMSLIGFSVTDATLGGTPLQRVRVQRGEVVADRSQGSVRGTGLVGAHFLAQVRNLNASPPATAIAEFRITDIDAEASKYDPTGTGHTFLYTLEQRVAEDGSWRPACRTDQDGRQAAIPIAATWNEHGDRVESSSLFTFGCTTGVIAKCYRWGYRPWLTGYGDSMVAMHQTCTRLARADYCGNGVPGTRDGTKINVWDRLPSPGPIQRHGGLLGLPLPPPGMLFEAGWNTNGAVCLSTARWLLEDGIGIIRLCPNKLVPPGLLLPTVCDTITTVLLFDPQARMFNESLNL